jgi:long-subunit fatty acid transport protein
MKKYLKSNSVRMIAIALVAAAAGLSAGCAIAGQPDMEGALASLQNAQSYLDRVTQNKAGHADKARHLVAAAIEQVQEGIEYGQEHGE